MQLLPGEELGKSKIQVLGGGLRFGRKQHGLAEEADVG